VQAEDGVGPWVVQRALLDHERRAAFLAGGRPFLRRLEHELDGAGQLLAHAGQDLGRAHQDGDVRIVPAGVHHAHLLAVVHRLGARAEGHLHLFRDRQGIHVRAQRHHWPGLAALEQADHAGVRHAGPHLHAQRTQVVGH
jgi:hypothetical protein